MGGLPTGLVLLALVCTGALAILLLRAYPLACIWAVFGALCLTPFWLGANVSVFFVSIQLLVMLVVAASLLTTVGDPIRWSAPDLLLLIFVVLLLVGFRFFGISLHSLYTTLSQWIPAYLAGRLVAARGREHQVAEVAGVMGAGIGLLGVVEFATRMNLWVSFLPMSNSLFTTWGPLQMRGGLLRAEGAFGHSIAFGACLAIMAVLSLGARFRPRTRVFLLACMMAGIAVTLSRIGMVALAIGIVLAVTLVNDAQVRQMRKPAFTMLGVAIVVTLVNIWSGLTSTEATESASYRTWILDLIPSLQPLGPATSANRLADGTLLFGAFRSIDSALLYIALQNGWLPTAILIVMAALAVATLLRRRATLASVALVAQLLALVSVALITQYGMFLFLVAGLAVSYAATQLSAQPLPPHHPHHSAAPDVFGKVSMPRPKERALSR